MSRSIVLGLKERVQEEEPVTSFGLPSSARFSKLKENVKYPMKCEICFNDFEAGVVGDQDINIKAKVINVDSGFETKNKKSGAVYDRRNVSKTIISYEGICPKCDHEQTLFFEETGRKVYGSWTHVDDRK